MRTESVEGEASLGSRSRVSIVRLLVSAAAVCATAAYVAGITSGRIAEANRIDGATLTLAGFVILLVTVLINPRVLTRLRAIEAAGVKVEMHDLREKQEAQARQLREMDRQMGLILPFLLPRSERTHLRNLRDGHTAGYRGNDSLRAELVRLRSIGLIASVSGRGLREVVDGSTFDLAHFVTLTPLGRRWLRRIDELKDIEAAELASDEQPPARALDTAPAPG